MNKVAILLASYNGCKFIRQQIQTILNQKNVQVTVFVSDDCSTDNTIEIVESIVSEDSRVKIVSKCHKYGSAAANFFSLVQHVDVDSYDYVAFSDQDDIWLEDKLEFAISALIKNNCNGFSSSIEAYWPTSGKKRLIIKSNPQVEYDHWFESPGPGCSQVFTKTSFINFKSFVINNNECLKRVDYHDWIIYAYYRFHNLGWHISSTSKMLYVQHEANQIGANSGWSSIPRRFNMVRTRWFRGQVNLIYKLVAKSNKRLVSLRFMSKNAFNIRRKKSHSFLLFFLFLIGCL